MGIIYIGRRDCTVCTSDMPWLSLLSSKVRDSFLVSPQLGWPAMGKLIFCVCVFSTVKKYYTRVQNNTLVELFAPHLHIYLDAPVKVLRERINQRNQVVLTCRCFAWPVGVSQCLLIFYSDFLMLYYVQNGTLANAKLVVWWFTVVYLTLFNGERWRL